MEQCQSRYEDMKKKSHANDKIFSAQFITADCTKVDLRHTHHFIIVDCTKVEVQSMQLDIPAHNDCQLSGVVFRVRQESWISSIVYLNKN